MSRGSVRRFVPAALAAAWLLVASSPAWAGEAHLYLAPYGFASSFTGEGRITGGSGTTGTDFDLEDTLGVDPDEKILGLDGFVKFLGNRISFGYHQGEYTGRETLGSDLVFNGVTFSASDEVRTKLDLTHYRVTYGFDFGARIVNVGFQVGVHVIDVEADVRTVGTGLRETEDLRAPIPVVGVSLGIHPISQLAIHGEVTGFSVTVSGVEATLVDGFAGVHYLFIPKFGVVAGYRYFLLEATDEDEDDFVDILQRGPYVGVALHL